MMCQKHLTIIAAISVCVQQRHFNFNEPHHFQSIVCSGSIISDDSDNIARAAASTPIVKARKRSWTDNPKLEGLLQILPARNQMVMVLSMVLPVIV